MAGTTARTMLDSLSRLDDVRDGRSGEPDRVQKPGRIGPKVASILAVFNGSHAAVPHAAAPTGAPGLRQAHRDRGRPALDPLDPRRPGQHRAAGLPARLTPGGKAPTTTRHVLPKEPPCRTTSAP